MACGEEVSDLCELNRLDRNLKDLEKQHNLQYRWSPSDREFQKYKSLLEGNKRKQLLSGLWVVSRRRRFVLKLKAKYAGKLLINVLDAALNEVLCKSYRWSKDC